MSVMLYKHPGPHEIHGDKFDYIVVPESGVDGAIKDGWHKTTGQALVSKPKPARKPKED